MDGQMVVLGGLQSSGLTTDKSKLGLLYEIPILSNLLGGRTKDLERTELLLFIRPHVIRPDEATADTKATIQGMSNQRPDQAVPEQPGQDARRQGNDPPEAGDEVSDRGSREKPCQRPSRTPFPSPSPRA